MKSRLRSLAEGDLSATAELVRRLMKGNPNARMLVIDDPRLPAMPEKPTLVDFFKLRFGPRMHLLQRCAARGEGRPTRRWCWPACCTTSRGVASSAATMAGGAPSSSSPMSTRK